MAVDHALGVAGGTRGVVERDGVPFVAGIVPAVVGIADTGAEERSDAGYSYSATVTGVPTGAFSKKVLAIPFGTRMQPCDAAKGGTYP